MDEECAKFLACSYFQFYNKVKLAIIKDPTDLVQRIRQLVAEFEEKDFSATSLTTKVRKSKNCGPVTY